VRLRPLVGLGVAALALTGLAGCSSSSSASGSAPFKVSGTPVRTDKVDLPKAYKFAPAVIEVKVGTTVTWTNHDDFPHNVTLMTGPDKTSKSLAIGETASIAFTKAGTVYYECTLHPQQMRGKVNVTES
jgi:plastocyanin